MTRSNIIHILSQHRPRLTELKVKRLALSGWVSWKEIL
jgi:hypothetical protein